MAHKSTFSMLFGKSPFDALQTHMRVAVECARDVKPLIHALAADDQAEVDKVKDRIFENEARADEIKHELRLHLPKSLFMPVDRRDLLEILDDRYGRSATLVATQVPVSEWHARFPDPTIGDAILDRLIHNAYRLNLQGESRRKVDSPLPMSTT